MNKNQSSFEVYSEDAIKASSEYDVAFQYLSQCIKYADNNRRALEELIYKREQQNSECEEKIRIANEKVKEAGLKAVAAWATWSSEQGK